MKQLIAYAKISDSNNSWEEAFEINSNFIDEATPLEQVQNVVDIFNEYLKPGESQRKCEEILRIEEVDVPEEEEEAWVNTDEFDEDFEQSFFL